MEASWGEIITEKGIRPCCPGAAAREIKQISVAGTKVGIAQMDVIFAKVFAMALDDENAIGKVLMKEVKIYNYVPSAREKDYSDSIMIEYRKWRI